MSFHFENPYLLVDFNQTEGTWKVHSCQAGSACLSNLRVALHWRKSKRSHLRHEDHCVEFATPQRVSEASPHSDLQILEFAGRLGPNSPQLTLKFALPETQPLLLWQLRVENLSSSPIYIDRLDLLRAEPSLGTIVLNSTDNSTHALAFFSQGWQSWSYSGAYRAHDCFHRTRLGPLQRPMQVNAGTPQPIQRGRFASDMFAVLGERNQRIGLLVGFLSQIKQFGTVYCQLDQTYPSLYLWANGDGLRLDPGAQIGTDWACLSFIHLDDPDPLGNYLQAVWAQNLSSLNPPEAAEVPVYPPNPEYAQVPRGWCSWYHYFQDVSAEAVRSNLQIGVARRATIPLDYWQIDDGYETRVGDWFSFRTGFPQGVAPLAKEIRTAGLRPGIWLAPYIVQLSSDLAREHPDWLLRGRLGRPVNAGYLWNSFTTALDLTHPEALAFTQQVVEKVAHQWGYPYIKLDFLYAGALPGAHRDPTLSRAQVLRQGLLALRAAAGADTRLLGCGCPLGSGIGILDAMRISADVDIRWKPAYRGVQLVFQDEDGLPAVRNAIHNTLTRAPLHRRWWINDPDCLILRKESELTLDEVQSLASVIALSGGSFFLSDDLTTLTEDRWQIARVLLPLIGQRPRLVDWMDTSTPAHLRLDLENDSGQWHLLAIFNWSDHVNDLTFRIDDFALDPQKTYTYREFWSGESRQLWHGGHTFSRVPAHGIRLLAVRPWQWDCPSYLGSNLHISQGLEVTTWERIPGETDPHTILRFKLERPGKTDGNIDLYLPRPLLYSLCNQQPVPASLVQAGFYRLRLTFHHQAEIEIRY